jgi:hypothetical protein
MSVPKPDQTAWRWMAPLTHFIKLNIDVSADKCKNGGACATFIRNEIVILKGLSAMALAGVTYLATLEALAWREGLVLAVEWEVINALHEHKTMVIYRHTACDNWQLVRTFDTVEFCYEG